MEPPSAWADHRQQLVPNITLCLGRFQDREIDSCTKLAWYDEDNVVAMTTSKSENVSGFHLHFQTISLLALFWHLAVVEPFREANPADMIYDPTAVQSKWKSKHSKSRMPDTQQSSKCDGQAFLQEVQVDSGSLPLWLASFFFDRGWGWGDSRSVNDTVTNLTMH